MKKQTAITPPVALNSNVPAFNNVVSTFLSFLELPTEDLVAPVEQRRIVVNGMEAALAPLSSEARVEAVYLSKFTIAVSVGLFDAALNYLWDETIKTLRLRVAEFDLAYFFDIAEKNERERKILQGADDLARLDDATFLDACTRIGFLNDVARERMRHVLYMRNHASAAHPSEEGPNGAELVSWLTNCLNYVIAATPDQSMIKSQQFLHNVRSTPIPGSEIPIITRELMKMGDSRIDDMLWILWGMYVDPDSVSIVHDNVEKLAPPLWQAASENIKRRIGARYAHYVKNAEMHRKKFANQFLGFVKGLRYQTEDLLVPEIFNKLDALHKAHHARNNF